MFRILKQVPKRYRKCPRYKYSTECISVPNQADVVIIGGGVAGCNTLYQLTKRGIKAVLLEKHKVTSGTTWHTSGILWRLRPSDVDILLHGATRNILIALEQETGQSPGWIQTGGIFIASNEDRLQEYKRMHTLGHYFDIESQIISNNEAAKLSPFLNPKNFMAALWSPGDGVADPSMWCAALIKAAETRGGTVIEHCPVTNILTENGTVTRKIKAVETPYGRIKTGCVVNAAGVWSHGIAKLVGLEVPVSPMKHAYIVTDKVPGGGMKSTPCLRDHDRCLYIRPQGESLVLGGYEKNPDILKEIPLDSPFHLYELNQDIFAPHIEKAIEICPIFGTAGIKTNVCGYESFTPDHKPIMGEDPKLLGLYHICGFNALGVQLSGGCAEQLAIWIATGRPDIPMFNYDIRRFSESQRTDRSWIVETSHESYATNYDIVFPKDQNLAGRNYKIDPFHEALIASGAVMEQVQGWERPGYFIKDRTAPVRGYDWFGYYDHLKNEDKRYEREIKGDHTFGFSKHHDLIGEEALAARNNVALFNLSCYTKMYLTGPDAVEVADWLFTANTNREPGRVIYSCSLNSKGGVEADVTVMPLQEGVGSLVGPIIKGKGFYVVAGGSSGYQTLSHFKKHLAKKNFRSIFTDISDKLGILSIQGPKSRDLLQSITETPITDEYFPVSMSHIIKINGHTCRAMRISYIGELGYEIHIPYASCVPVYNKIIDAGRGFDLKLAGARAMDDLSLEKGHYLWNADLRSCDNPVEANLDKVCRKVGVYNGKQHVEKMRHSGIKKRRVFFTVEDKVALFGLETVWRDDNIVGYLRRGGYGYTMGCSIGTGYVQHPKGRIIDEEFLRTGNYQIEVLNKKYPATMYLKSPFDPKNARVLGQYDHQFQEQQHFED